ncbi:unnamed protein product [Somion occarium]|uniref:HIT-type domain-containing protein n=1 Tax=Somion occarium TaxID=3059160 RepID=A0ABP1CZ18_9APHY
MEENAVAGPSEPKDDSSPTDGSSTASQSPICAICTKTAAVYTCPRCSTRTCSLACSQTHKTQGEGCSGVRNKAAYVPMNQYGYMALMDDYVFLEDVGRKVGDWGKEIVQGGYTSTTDGNRGRGRDLRGRGRGRGRETAIVHGNPIRNKRDTLKMELDFRDIEMDMLPVGMERRTLNQSTWDFKNKTALLTIEFIFHPPPNPYPSSAPEQPFTLLTHRNRFEDSILTCVQSKLAERGKSKKEKPIPVWVIDLIAPNPDDVEAFTNPTCVMPTKVDPLASLQSRPTILRPGHIVREGYYKLEPTESLEKVLRHKQFVEYPTIEIWEDGSFNGTVVDDRGAVMHNSEDERKPKRRKLGVREGRKAINGLLGGYGSEDEEEEDEKEERNVMGLLAGYTGSDEEGEGDKEPAPGDQLPPPSPLDEDEWGDEDAEGETDDEYVEESAENVAAMLEKLRQAGVLRDPSSDGRVSLAVDEDEQVDWGDSGDEGTVS